MLKKKFAIATILILFITCQSILCADRVNGRVYATVEKENGIYEKGENIVFSGIYKENEKPVSGVRMKYILLGDGGLHQEEVYLSSDNPKIVQAKLDFPGWVHISYFTVDEKGNRINDGWEYCGHTGAMVDPYNIKTYDVEPTDFDDFWKAVKKDVCSESLTISKKEIELPEKLKEYKGKIRCWDVSISCRGTPPGKPLTGYLAMPSGPVPEGGYVAVLKSPGAGVGNADLDGRIAEKAIFFSINIHGSENGKSPEYYKDLELENYPYRGIESRESFYYNAVARRIIRSLQFLKSLPEWNKKTLVAYGGSQGGGLSLWAAGLDPDVTLCVAGVPALCDHTASRANPPRTPGWIGYYKWKEDDNRVVTIARTLSYYDSVYFARRIKAKTYIGTGFSDYICPPNSVFAMYNELPNSIRKEITTTPGADHGAPNTAGERRLDFVLNNGRRN